jgi:hypothetical protein
MTRQTDFRKCLGGSPAGPGFSRLLPLTLAAIVLTAGAALSQSPPVAAKPAQPVETKKPSTEPEAKVVGGYMVHQSLEVGGRMTTISGSNGMWDTLVNQSSGGRILGQSLEMHSVNPSKTPLFDTLTTNSTGYGGDPYDMSYLRFSKGRIYDFAGSFRRDRQYFDYNLLANSLNSDSAGLVPELDSPHLFNTVRRNSDVLLTILPLSLVSFRAGFNRGIHEGPSYSSVHEGADGWLFQNWNNASNTYTFGADVKLARRTTLSYDQFLVRYQGNSSWELAGLNATLPGGTPVSFGLDPGSVGCPGVVAGVGLPTCNGYLAMSITQPIRTSFETEALRFSTHYWDRVSMNARLAYSGAKSTVTNFNETFNGLTTRTSEREEIDTGAGPNGQMASNKRDNLTADYGIVAELSKYISVSDAFTYWGWRVPGSNNITSTVYTDTNTPPSMLDPLSSITPVTTTTPNLTFLNQKIGENTVLATFTIASGLNVSGGWRYKNRNITDYGMDDLTWHENGAVLGAVIQPSRVLRLNINFDSLNAKSATAATPSNTFTREAPNKAFHLRARATIKPAKWINFAITGSDHSGKNDDPLVNHFEHNHDLSFAASVIPMEGLSLDFNYAYDDVFSVTDICYVSSAPLINASNSGTCTATNSPGIGGATYLLGDAYYHVPAKFISASLNYSPSKYVRMFAGARVNSVNGQAEELNPNMTPGALQSKFVTPFADMQIKIAAQWEWHGNWTHDGYAENGLQNPLLPSRNTHGDIVTLGVKYVF